MNNFPRCKGLPPATIAAIFVSFAFATVAAQPRAWALSCLQPEFQRNFDYADQVFEGVARTSTDTTERPQTAEFDVARVWKGPLEPFVRLAVSPDWGPFFTAGVSYIVFARAGAVELCSFTGPTSESAQTLEKLGPGQAPAHPIDGGADGAASSGEAEAGSGCSMALRPSASPFALVCFGFVGFVLLAQRRQKSRVGLSAQTR